MALRVLIVDDSPFVRQILREGLSHFPEIEIVGEAADGLRAIPLVAELMPDVVTMDVVMPMIGGLDTIRTIMEQCPTPIVVVADADGDVERLALDAMEAGAVEVYPKPRRGFDLPAAEELASLIKTAAGVKLPQVPPREMRSSASRSRSARLRAQEVDFVGIVASTGGPQTLVSILADLPRTFPVPIAIVQHTASGFTSSLATWLGANTSLDVSLARIGARVRAGQVAIAPDDLHLEIDCTKRVTLRAGRGGGHIPSGNVFLRSLASSFGRGAVGVVLTGMGRDGAEGLAAIESAGGLAIIQDPKTAILEGMPNAAMRAVPRGITGAPLELSGMLRELLPSNRSARR